MNNISYSKLSIDWTGVPMKLYHFERMASTMKLRDAGSRSYKTISGFGVPRIA